MKKYLNLFIVLAGVVVVGAGLIWVTGGVGYSTDNALAKIVKPRKPSVTVKLISTSITPGPEDSAYDSRGAEATFRFTIKAKGGDVLITGADALILAAYKGNKPQAKAINAVYAIENATWDGSVFTISRDTTATVEARAGFQVLKKASESGFWSLRITGLRLNDGSVKKLNFKTPRVQLP